jgi:hypothetical protein
MITIKPSPSARAMIRQLLGFAGLFYFAVQIATTPLVVVDPDIGWHLRAGQWIFENDAVPTTDPFSLYGQGKPWVAYSWLFEIIVYGLVKTFGLAGLFVYTVSLSIAITTVLLLLIRKIEKNPVVAICLTFLAILAMGPVLQTPRPWLLTILLFIIELDVLITARQTGNYRNLLALPLLFAFWANLHIQFIYGLFVLGIFLIEPLIEEVLRPPFTFNNIKSAFNYRHWLILLACLFATLATPYHIHLYSAVFDIVNQTGAYRYVSELQAMSFRDITNWLVLGLTIWAVYLLGQKKEARPFIVLLLLTGIFLSFRSQRDVWFIVLSAIIIVATSRPSPSAESRFKIRKAHMFVALTMLSLVLLMKKHSLSDVELTETVAKKYPAKALQIIKTQGYLGPLYNHFDWGGYLIRNLPELPVSIDGRGNLHGDERIEKSIKTWGGSQDWANDPNVTGAKLIIADVTMPLTSLLRFDKRFDLVYEDKVAALFVAKPTKIK